MTPQEKIIIGLWEIRSILQYYNNEAEWSEYIDPAEFMDDYEKLSSLIDKLIENVHETYQDKQKVNEVFEKVLNYVYSNYGRTNG